MHPLNHPVIRHVPANYRPARPIRAHRMQGAAIVEFSLIFPILLLTIFGVVEFCIALYDKAVITNAAREAARYGVAFTSPARTNSQVQGVATSYCQNRLVTFGSAANCTVASVTPCAGSGNPLTVTVSYSFTGLALAKALAPFTGSISLNSQTTMLCE